MRPVEYGAYECLIKEEERMVMPATGPDAIIASMLYQNSRRGNWRSWTDWDDELTLKGYAQMADRTLRGIYATCVVEPTFPVDTSDAMSRFVDALLSMVPVLDHGAGYPWAFIYPDTKTNGDWIAKRFDELKVCVQQRLTALSQCTVSQLAAMTPIERVQAKLADAKGVFVKNEPHAKSKASQQRWRLIFPTGIVDQIIHRLIVGEWVKAHNNAHLQESYAPGMDMSSNGGCEAQSKIFATFKRPACVDVSGWDWTVLWQEQLMSQVDMLSSPRMTQWSRQMMLKIELIESWPVFILPCNNEQPVNYCVCLAAPGLMTSGRYQTSETNTKIQIATMCGLMASGGILEPCCRAMGDDGVCNAADLSDEQIKSWYACRGKLVKEVIRDRIEFCSHLFDISKVHEGQFKVQYLNFAKSLAHWLATSEQTRDVDQFMQAVARAPECIDFLRVLAAEGGGVSQRWFNYVRSVNAGWGVQNND